MPLLKMPAVEGLQWEQQEQQEGWNYAPPPTTARMATATAASSATDSSQAQQSGDTYGSVAQNANATAGPDLTPQPPSTIARIANVFTRPGSSLAVGAPAGNGPGVSEGELALRGYEAVNPELPFGIGPAIERAKEAVPRLNFSAYGPLVPAGGAGGNQNLPTMGDTTASFIPSRAADTVATLAPFAPAALREAGDLATAGREATARIATRALENTAPTLDLVRPTTGPDALLYGTAMPEVVNPTRPMSPSAVTPAGGAPDEPMNLFDRVKRQRLAERNMNRDFVERPAPAAVTPPVDAVAPSPPAAPAGAEPATDLETALRNSLKGMTRPQTENLTVGQMRTALDEAGLASSGTPSQVSSRYRGMVAAGRGGINTPIENVSNAARAAYQTALEQTGNPESARLAARRAAAREVASNTRAGDMAAAQAELRQTLADEAERGLTPGIGGGADVPENNPATTQSFGWLREAARSAASVPGELISLKSSVSPPLLRQGKIRLVTSPGNAMKEFWQSLSAAFSEGKGRDIVTTIEKDPWIRDTQSTAGREAAAADRYAKGQGVASAGKPVVDNAGYTWKDVGGTILDWGTDATAATRVEERTVTGDSALTRKVRGLPFIAASDRQAAVELNLHRTSWYREVASKMWQAGERNIEEYKQLRQFIEHATQRGDVPRSIQQMPLWFSARAQAGRAQFLYDLAKQVPYGVMTGRVARPGVQQEAAKALVGMVTANMAQLSAMSAAGLGTLELGPGLPTLRRGGHHDDPWAGWNAQSKLVLGIGHDIVKEFGLGKDKGWEDVPQDFAQRIGQRALDFGRKGLSPAYGTAISTATGQDFLGHPYNLADEVKSGKLAADWTLPFVAEELAAAYKESGPLGVVAEAVPASLSEGLSTYTSLGDLRDDAARKAGAASYNDATPLIREQIDASPEIAKFRDENPSNYQRAKSEIEAGNPAIQEAARAEESFSKAVPIDKALQDKWHDESIARQAIAAGLASQFKKMFASFDQTKFDKAVKAYYDISKTDTEGNFDYDATEAARQDWFEQQQPDVRQWVDEALQVSRDKKTPLHQAYLDYIDQRKALGYFALDPTSKDYTAKLAALDAANPAMDAANSYWKSDVKGKKAPALNSAAAVDIALQQHPDRPIYMASVPRAVNTDEGSIAAWQASKKAISVYFNPPQNLLEQEAQAKYKKAYAALPPSGTASQETVRSAIHKAMQDQIPQLDAWLAWWGIGASNNVLTFNTPEAVAEFKKIAEKYGKTAPKPDVSFKLGGQ